MTLPYVRISGVFFCRFQLFQLMNTYMIFQPVLELIIKVKNRVKASISHNAVYLK